MSPAPTPTVDEPVSMSSFWCAKTENTVRRRMALPVGPYALVRHSIEARHEPPAELAAHVALVGNRLALPSASAVPLPAIVSPATPRPRRASRRRPAFNGTPRLDRL